MPKLMRFLAATLFAAQLLAISAPAAMAEEYTLGAGDKLRIKVNEWPDISGEYLVSPAVTVSLPLIGELQVAGVTTRELMKTISERVAASAKLASNPSCTVEVVTFRPFFVLGDVQKPGEYAYRPGLTVLQAVSVAGGYYRPTETAFRLERDAIAARGEILVRAREMKALTARIARLEAEQKNAAMTPFPGGLDNSPGSPDRALIDEENTILAANNKALADTQEMLDRYVKLYTQEIETVKIQIASENRQHAAVNEEFEGLKTLAEKGLTSLSRRLVSERALAQIESTIQGLEATILRARQNISQTEQRRIETINARTDRINRELQEARAKAKDTDYQLKTARNLLLEAEVVAPALYATNRDAKRQAKFIIARSKNGETSEMNVESTASVLPGDVLTIDRASAVGSQQSILLPEAEARASN
jgi:protein involved in polysaccharide export with SLBB domain